MLSHCQDRQVKVELLGHFSLLVLFISCRKDIVEGSLLRRLDTILLQYVYRMCITSEEPMAEYRLRRANSVDNLESFKFLPRFLPLLIPVCLL